MDQEFHYNGDAGVSFKPDRDEGMYELGWIVALATYLSFAVLIVVGRIRDLFGLATGTSRFYPEETKPGKAAPNANTKTIYEVDASDAGGGKGKKKIKVTCSPLLSLADNFYIRRLYTRIQVGLGVV